MRSAVAFLVLLASVSSARPGAAPALELAREGRALAVIRVAGGALPAEAKAARELADYLERATSAPFEIVSDDATPAGPSIEIGPTRLARESDAGIAELGPEAWVVRADGEHLFLYGGRPTGTQHAVYRFLEGHVGVRWWTPFEESVPHTPALKAAVAESRGEPAFAFREIRGADGPVPFNAGNRLNGSAPSEAHDFYTYVSPDEFFDDHPEYFSEIVGLRYAGKGQLCLTNEDLVGLAASRVLEKIETERREARLRGERPPRWIGFTQNDWGGACTCDACSEMTEKEGSGAGPLIAFVNRLAEAVAQRYPGVRIITLARDHTWDPPLHVRAADGVIVQLSGLDQRDLAKRVTHPDNSDYRKTLEDWRDKVRHLRILDTSSSLGPNGDLPLPNLPRLTDDFRFYRELGAEGISIDGGSPVAGDMRDLKLWVLAKLLEDPARDQRALVREFTDGYYGRAGPPIRRYLDLLDGPTARRQPGIHLDRDLIVRGQRLFDRAERRAAGDPDLLRRVRHARLTLDRATLARWRELEAEGPLPFDRWEMIRRYRLISHAEIERRLDESEWNDAKNKVESQIDVFVSTGDE